ncbi:MAG: hypothetical protein IKP96_03840 [Elusimicrobiaceae bacterium]|nr:hypothetical protein [Elusimicrobiaceae bacterium]
MKKIICFSFLLLLAVAGVYASEWGIPAASASKDSTIFSAIDNLIEKRPIRYAVSSNITETEEKLFIENIYKWPQETLAFIKKTHRENEFSDIIPILKHKIEVLRVDEREPHDVFIDITDSRFLDPDGNNTAYYYPHKKHLVIEQKYRQDADFLFLHEIGHFFGLADQYEEARLTVHPEYSSDVDMHSGSVMEGLHSISSNHLTYDDADGFINLIDLHLFYKNGTFSPRVQNGWNSLNPDSPNKYKNIRTINRRAQDFIKITENLFKVNEYKDGKLTNSFWLNRSDENILSLFRIGPKDVVYKDPTSLLITAIRSKENTVPFCAQGKYKGPVSRVFTYDFLPQDPLESQAVSVSCVADGQNMASYTFIFRDKNSIGFFLSAEQNASHQRNPFQIYPINVFLSFQDGTLRRLQTSATLLEPGTGRMVPYSLLWNPYAMPSHIVQRNRYASRILSSKKDLLASDLDNLSLAPQTRAQLYAVHAQNIRDAKNFEKAFYTPLFQHAKKLSKAHAAKAQIKAKTQESPSLKK